MTKVRTIRDNSKQKISKRISAAQAALNNFELPNGESIDSEYEVIQMLLPSAVKEFFCRLSNEVEELCGKLNKRGAATRWGTQGGSIYLGGQRIAIEKPRVRDAASGKEVILTEYERFNDPTVFDKKVFRDGLRHVSQRNYEVGVEQIGGSFGFSKSSVSRSWKRATSKQLKELQERALEKLNIVAVLIDGKRFRSLGVVVALGVSEDGKKHVLGAYQAHTETGAACLELLADLERRGLPRFGLLFVVDGGSGLNKALEQKYQVDDPKRRRAIRVRCYIHKWRNLEDILGKDTNTAQKAKELFWKMRNAKSLSEASQYANKLEAVLRPVNISALRSFREAKADLLVLHEVGLTGQLKRFFSTTNAIESLNSLLEEDLRRVKRWRDSEHFQRWLATAILNNEKRMHRIRGFKGLVRLKARLFKLCSSCSLDQINKAA